MIDRKKVIKAIETHLSTDISVGCDDCTYENDGWCTTRLLADILALLKEQKAEAKWIYGEDETGVDGWHCSECNFFEPWFYDFTEDVDFIRFYEHCPRCGRKMTSYTGKPTQNRR